MDLCMNKDNLNSFKQKPINFTFENSFLIDNYGSCERIFQDKNKNIWLIGCRMGLIEYNSKNYTLYKNPKYNTDKDLFYIYQHEDESFWIASSQGLILYQPNNNREPFKVLTTSDGLTSNFIWIITFIIHSKINKFCSINNRTSTNC